MITKQLRQKIALFHNCGEMCSLTLRSVVEPKVSAFVGLAMVSGNNVLLAHRTAAWAPLSNKLLWTHFQQALYCEHNNVKSEIREKSANGRGGLICHSNTNKPYFFEI